MRIDLKKLSSIDIPFELEKRGISFKKSQYNLMMNCPFHNEKNPSFGISFQGNKKGLYRCMSANCGRTGTFFDLIAFLDEITLEEAVKKFDIGFDLTHINNLKSFLFKKLQQHKNKIKIINSKVLEDYVEPDGEYLKYLIKRKLSLETVKKFSILACQKDLWQNRIIIPVYDEYNRLISLTARSILGNISKRLKVRKVKNSDISKVLFGLNHIDNRKKLYLVEGEIDAMYLQQYNIPAVSIGSISISKTQLKKIIKYCTEVIIALDGDVEIKTLKKIRDELSSFVKVKILRLPEEKDPNDLTEKEVKKIFKVRSKV